jgi:lysophospholipase L1-like esterase
LQTEINQKDIYKAMNRLNKLSATVLALLAIAGTASAQKTDFKFEFGAGIKVKDGYTSVTPATTFTKDMGYGFDIGSMPQVVDNGGRDPFKASNLTGDKPFYFSVDVPEGNYKVTVTLGDAKQASVTTVRAESRRLMLEKVETKAGEFVTKTFIVNIRKPQISTGGRVSLTSRETNKLDWDDKLTLEFNNTHPAVAAVEITKVTDQITVYLAGNSTVADQAESGLTLGSFIGSHRLDKVMSIIKPGDYLFIEFGHNDQKEHGPNDGPYKSYTERFEIFIEKAKSVNAIPVIVTSTSRRSFNDSGKVVNSLGEYPAAARKVAAEMGVAMIDVNAMTAAFYNALGKEASTKAFVHYPPNTWPGQGDKPLADNTHFNSYGAYEIAKCVIEGIRSNHLGLEKYLIDAPKFNPSHPDDPNTFSLPVSSPSPVLRGAAFAKPAGN